MTAFVLAGSQWRTAATAVAGRTRIAWIGLDYAGAAIAWNAAEITVRGALFEELQIMEAAVCDALNGVRHDA